MFWTFVIGLIIFCVIIGAIQSSAETKKMSEMSAPQRKQYQEVSHAAASHGPANAQLICPHCEERGKVHTKLVKQKKGVSGAKATGAIFTGGVSLLATGLSRKENLTEAYCRHCSSTWHF